jgi:hypothetical protein
MLAPSYTLYQRLPGLVLGFHGCDREVGEAILCGSVQHLIQSENKYDWLGSGIYFWENDPLRAWEFAEEGNRKPKHQRGHIAEPFVIGAVIDLGFCLNLTDRRALDELSVAYDTLKLSYSSGEQMPENKGSNFGARFRDRAVIEMLHATRGILDEEEPGTLPQYDSVRSPFPEGDFLYEGAGFQAKNHIQIAVRNTSCIKGYFRPIPG